MPAMVLTVSRVETQYALTWNRSHRTRDSVSPFMFAVLLHIIIEATIGMEYFLPGKTFLNEISVF
jgi:hypothetical protein